MSVTMMLDSICFGPSTLSTMTTATVKLHFKRLASATSIPQFQSNSDETRRESDDLFRQVYDLQAFFLSCEAHRRL